MSISERQKEIRRRRKRRANYAEMKQKVAKDSSVKEKFAAKLRKMTPGAEVLIKSWGLE